MTPEELQAIEEARKFKKHAFQSRATKRSKYIDKKKQGKRRNIEMRYSGIIRGEERAPITIEEARERTNGRPNNNGGNPRG